MLSYCTCGCCVSEEPLEIDYLPLISLPKPTPVGSYLGTLYPNTRCSFYVVAHVMERDGARERVRVGTCSRGNVTVHKRAESTHALENVATWRTHASMKLVNRCLASSFTLAERKFMQATCFLQQ